MSIRGELYREQSTRVLTDSDQPLFCKSLQFAYTNQKTGIVTQKQEYDFSDQALDPSAPDQFLLSAYGLPEPTDRDALASSWFSGWMLWAGVAIVSLILMIVFRRLSRR